MTHLRPTVGRITLHCNHVVLYYPLPETGDIVYCRRCADWRRVVELESEKIQLKVKCGDCKFSRLYPLGHEEIARIKGKTHSLRRKHKVFFIDHEGQAIVI